MKGKMKNMASSGTINNTFRTGYAIRIVWNINSQSVSGNTSNITAKVQLVSLGSSYTIVSSATKNGSLTINGVTYNFTFSAALSGNQVKTLFTKTVDIAHNSDGSKTCAFSTTCGINVTLGSTYFGNVSASGNGTFNSIARASTISSVTSSVAITGSNAVTVSISRASSSFTHTVTYSFGSYTYTQTGIGTSASYTIPVAWMNAIPNATTGQATVQVTTYSGSTKIGTTATRTFTVTIPSTVVPSIDSVSIYEATDGIASQFNAFVQNKSAFRILITATGTYSSTIKSIKTTVDGIEYNGSPAITNILTQSGSREIKIVATDSRGRTATAYRYRDVVAYTSPTITTFKAFRCNGSGQQVYEGCCVCVRMKFDIASVNNANTKAYSIEYKLKSASQWTSLASGSVYSYDDTMVFHEILTTDNSYDIRLTITDFFTSASAMTDLPTAFTLVDMNASGQGIAFGKVSELNAMEIALDIYDKNNRLIEGKNDSGWINLNLNTGWSYQYTADIPQYRKINGVVYLRGLANATAEAGTTIATLPEGFRPYGSFNRFACALNQNQFANVQVNYAGVVSDYTKGSSSRTFLCLNGIAFLV